MLDQALKTSIETYAHSALASNPIFVLAENGQMSVEQVHYYLSGVLQLISRTPSNLERAIEVCQERGHTELCTFFQEKLSEERGHDDWAREGISRLSAFHKGPLPAMPVTSPSIGCLTTMLVELIETDPYLFVPYVFLAEYFTVLVGPTLIRNLAERCQIPTDCMSVVGNHVELDKEHVLYDLGFVSKVPEAYRDPYLGVIGRAMQYYDSFAQEVQNATPAQV